MDKRTLMFVSSTLLIWMAYFAFIAPPVPEPEALAPASAESPVPATAAGGPAAAVPLGGEAASGTEAVALPDYDLPAAAAERVVTVDGPLYQAEFSTRGAVLTAWRLKRYMVNGGDPQGPDNPPVNLIPDRAAVNGRLPLRLDIGEGGKWSTEDVIFHTDAADTVTLADERASSTLVFTAVLPERGVALTKTLTFAPDSYVLECRITVANLTDQPQDMRFDLLLGGEIRRQGNGSPNPLGAAGPVTMLNNEREVTKVAKLKEPLTLAGGIPWSAFLDTYFAVAVLPAVMPAEVIISPPDGKSAPARLALRLGDRAHPARSQQEFSAAMFFGPINTDVLAAEGHQLGLMINYGLWTPIATILLEGLKIGYRYTGNWGIAIILLTVVVKLLLLPLTLKQMSSMGKMQAIQPKMTEIRNKHRGNSQKMNEEMMKLYKEHGVNPMGGCMPMLFQIPVFFALYRVLLQAIELRGAPFFLYIHDLSAPDPLPIKISALLMGASMFAQQKLTPMAGDPRQARMMMMMPVIFTALFWNFPTGLVIYWLTNNVLAIAQQLVTMRMQKTGKRAKAGSTASRGKATQAD